MKKLLQSKSGLPPTILQLLGILLMLVAVAAWLFPPHDFNAALFGGGGSLLGISEFAGATQRLNKIQEQVDKYMDKEERVTNQPGKRGQV